MNEYITTGNLLRLNQLLMDRICDIIGCAKGFSFEVDMSFIKCQWRLLDTANKNAKLLEIIDNDGDAYEYTISSLNAEGEKLFMGTENDLTFIMCREGNAFPIIVVAEALQI